MIIPLYLIDINYMLLLLLHNNDDQYFVTFYQKFPSNTRTLNDLIVNIIVSLLIAKQQYQQVAIGTLFYFYLVVIYDCKKQETDKIQQQYCGKIHAVQYDDNNMVRDDFIITRTIWYSLLYCSIQVKHGISPVPVFLLYESKPYNIKYKQS